MIEWWTGLAAAKKYLTGKRASVQEQWRRAGVCAECVTSKPSRDTIRSKLISAVLDTPAYWTCGEELKEVPGESCGCVVLAETDSSWLAITVKGKPIQVAPAGKAKLLAEKCPQGKW